MDEKARIKAIDAALANLRQQLIDRVPHHLADRRAGMQL